MSRMEDAVARLGAGGWAVVIDEDRPAEGHLLTAAIGAEAADLLRLSNDGAGPIELVFDADEAAAVEGAASAHEAAQLGIVSRPAAAHGVLGRAGIVEAAIDVLRLAGRPPVGLLTMLSLPGGILAADAAADEYAAGHDCPLISVQDVVAYRLSRESIVEAVSSARLPSIYADRPLEVRAFRGRLDGVEHLALLNAPFGPEPLVRIHSECLTGDALGSLRCDCGDQLRRSLQLVGESGQGGVVVYLRGQEGRGIGLANKIRAYELQDLGRDTVEANEELGFPADLRDYGVAVQILAGLGIERLRLLSNNPKKAEALERCGIVVAERVGLTVGPNPHNTAYLETKRVKLGHDLAADEPDLPRAAAE